MQLAELELFLDSVEDFLDAQARRAESEEERRKLADYFPNLLRSSLFVTIYSTLENELNRLCRELSKEDGLDVEDLRGSGIIRAGTFLSRVCRVDFPQESKEWKRLLEYNQLRNIIVHNNGKVDGNGHLDSSIRENAGLDIKKGIVHLGRDFCPLVLEVIRDFMELLSIEVHKKTGISRDSAGSARSD